jgi:putative endonuclease
MGLVQFIAEVFSRSGRPSFPSPENEAHALGRRGEDVAARQLKRDGYKVLYRNYRARGGGEVDVVCRDRKTDELVFVEVKTRRTRDYGDPARQVDAEKQKLIARGALAWLRMLDNPDICFRFDIAEVVINDGGTSVNVIQNAFSLPKPYLY